MGWLVGVQGRSNAGARYCEILDAVRSSTELKATVRFRCQVPSQRRAEEWREDSTLCFVLDAAVAGVSVSSLRSPPGTRYLAVLRGPFSGPPRELRSLTGVRAVRQPQLLTQRLLLTWHGRRRLGSGRPVPWPATIARNWGC